MKTYFTELKKTEVTKTHNGFNYAEITLDYGNDLYLDVTYECNCSIFKTESEVKKFIELVF